MVGSNVFNEWRASNFVPSDLICIDESFSRWYGVGGDSINVGLPHYVAMDRKPEAGLEIQNAACGRSKVMMRLKLVKNIGAEDPQADDAGLLHGTVVLKQLLDPWIGQSTRIVCADFYFASVGATLELERLGFRFIGVIKTATKQFPIPTCKDLNSGAMEISKPQSPIMQMVGLSYLLLCGWP
jgi:hypothetical protein